MFRRKGAESRVLQFRKQIDLFMQQHPQSPLDTTQRLTFGGLAYFDVNEALRFELDVVRFPESAEAIEMQTSTGDAVQQRPWGRVTLEVEGELASLTIYTDGRGLFLPFRDATSGDETYGAGRYLDSHRPGLDPLGDDRLLLDFNYAYNPYCAYSPDYSCPLPPRENWLSVPIRAGEKRYSE